MGLDEHEKECGKILKKPQLTTRSCFFPHQRLSLTVELKFLSAYSIFTTAGFDLVRAQKTQALKLDSTVESCFSNTAVRVMWSSLLSDVTVSALLFDLCNPPDMK